MLDDLITRTTLEDLAGATAFRRGEEYFSAGAVGRLRVTDEKVTAQVEGTESYQVELHDDDDGELAYDCTCPRAASGNKKRRDPWRDIQEYLASQPPETLIDLLLDVAQRDDRLYQSLLLKAERSGGDGNLVKAYRKAIDGATHIRGFVDWREVGAFAGNIDQVVDSLAESLKPDSAAALVELAEYAIERVENALEQVDDSNGEVGEAVYRLGELHRQACAMARPEPTALAERLFRFETTLPFGLCSFDADTYRDALGAEGLRRYRELAEAEWREIKPRGGGDAYDAHRSCITRIMEHLAKASGDVKELVAIKARDLSLPYCYLDIAAIWTQAGQPDKALEWAERGLKAFPERPDNRLRDFLAAAYLQRERNDEALQLTWIQFEERPSLEYYKKLHDVAGKLGLWLEQRDRALAKVAEAIAREAGATSHWKPQPSIPNYSLRVEIALWEEDLDAAWSAAHAGVCERNLLITLAGRLGASRPKDAIALYRRVVPPIVEQTNNYAYAEATKLIRKVGGLMQALNQSRQFGDYLAELRVQFKPKRNFIKLLDGVARSVVT
jgi:tetratricopeptide (TPR) repeat protein